MNYIDIILVVPFIFLVVKGFLSGFINQIAGLLGLIAGLYFAYNFYPEANKILLNYLKSDYNNIIAFILIFITVYFGVSIVGKLLTKASKALALSPLNRVLGMVLGALKGLVVMFVLLFILNYAKELNNSEIKQALSNSTIYEILSPIVKEYDLNSINSISI